jgi:hypothetical protein
VQVLGLAGRKDGRRLVEDENARVSCQCLHDLHPLLRRHRKIPDEGGRIDRETGRGGDFAGATLGCTTVEPSSAAEDDVLRDRERGNEGEVLVHHPQPRRDRVLARTERDRLTAQRELAGVGMLEAERDSHQRRLAGAVLAE